MTLLTGDPNPVFRCCDRCGRFFADTAGTISASICYSNCHGWLTADLTADELRAASAAYALGGYEAVEAMRRPGCQLRVFSDDALAQSFRPLGWQRKKPA